MSGRTHTEELRKNLTCPGCSYSLRGLRGARIRCPECGTICDVAKMLRRRWTRPWHEAPRFGGLVAPVSVMAIGGLFFGVVGLAMLTGARLPTTVALNMLLGAIATLLLWIGLVTWASLRFKTQSGFVLCIIAHGVFLGYCACLAAIATCCIRGFVLFETGRTASMILGIVWFIASIVPMVVFRYFRRGERYIAERCIREYLQRPT